MSRNKLNGSRPSDLVSGKRRNLAGDSNDRHGIAAVRGDVELENGLIELEVFAYRRADRRIRGQLENSGRSFGEPEFFRGAQHAERFHAAQLRRFDLQPA